jgi:arginyl-tRNA--protein-N-Asp/Glu arginylyltransferase
MTQWNRDLSEVAHFTTPPYRCSYLPGRTAALTYRLPTDLPPGRYDELLRRGWRRFGGEFFRSACPACGQCRSLRLLVSEFTPSRSQRRALRQNAQIRVVVQAPTVSATHLQLFNAYHVDMHRRKGWPFHRTDEGTYRRRFLRGEWAFAREFLYYEGDRLVGVGLADVTATALSSVYFFHDPAWRPRAPGVFSILRHAAYAREQGLRYHYLGYWVAGSPSMAYKAQYRPHELLLGYPADGEEPRWIKPGTERPGGRG